MISTFGIAVSVWVLRLVIALREELRLDRHLDVFYDFDDLSEVVWQLQFLLVQVANLWRNLTFLSFLWENFSSLEWWRWRAIGHWLLILVGVFLLLLEFAGNLFSPGSVAFRFSSVYLSSSLRTGTLFFIRWLVDIVAAASDFGVVFVCVKLPVTSLVKETDEVFVGVTGIVYTALLALVEDEQEHADVAKDWEFDRLLEEALLSLAVGHLSVVVVFDHFDLVDSSLAHEIDS